MQAWDEFLKCQEEELGAKTVQKWLRTLKVLQFDACNLYLEAKDSFQALWFEEHIRNKALTQFVNGNHKRIKVHLSIANAPVPQKKKNAGKNREKDSEKSLFQLQFDGLDHRCQFDQYIVAEENFVSCQLLSELAGYSQNSSATQLGTFNPIYIYGGTGSGKTYLLTSLANIFQSKGLKVLYVRAETFTEHVVMAIRAGQMSLFRQTYRNIDVLLVDDIYVFSQKWATQEEFFHTFNTLHMDNKQIILTSNCSPAELKAIEPRLISRFEWGIVLPLKQLSGTNLHLMLKARAQALSFPLSDKIIEFLVETFKSSPKALIRSLEALVLRMHLEEPHSSQSFSVASVRVLLKDLIEEELKSAITPSKIILETAENFGIRVEDVLGKAQNREFTLPRQIAMYLCRTDLQMPFTKIGELFDRDHSTVMTSVKQIQKGIEGNNLDLASAIHSISKKLQ